MAEVLLFHHALGLTPGVHAFADSLRAGRAHRAHARPLRRPDLRRRRRPASATPERSASRRCTPAASARPSRCPTSLVYAGFSLGVMSAQRLAQTRDGRCGSRADGVLRPGDGVRRPLALRVSRCRCTAWTPTSSSSATATSSTRASIVGRPTGASCSSTPATATSSRTRRPRATTPTRRRCCSSGCWRSSTPWARPDPAQPKVFTIFWAAASASWSPLMSSTSWITRSWDFSPLPPSARMVSKSRHSASSPYVVATYSQANHASP